MCELARHPRVLSRLQEELRSVNLGSVSFQQIDALPLLDALLTETLRCCPPAMGSFIRQVPDEGLIIGGYSIPGGTTVGVSTHTLHRNSDVFLNPLDWNPDRWLNAKPEEKKQMMKWYWAFGSGGRICIGKHLAICSK